MAIDRIKFDGPPNVLIWKYPKDNIKMKAKLIVNESQEALFFKGGQALDLFQPGTHTISTKNLPLLEKLVNLPYGGETPFTAEVFFINKTSRLDYKWGTPSPIPVEDPKYKTLISVGCFGQYGIYIKDSRVFVTRISGTMPVWDSNAVLDYFRGVILTRVKDTVAKFLVKKDISISSITAYLEEISQVAEDRLRSEFDKYGLELLKFFISSITIPDEELKKIQKGAFDRLEMEQIGDHNYQLKRSFDVMEAAANNPGAAGTLMAGGMGLGMGAQMASTVSQIAQKSIQQDKQPTAQEVVVKDLECPNCHKKLQANSKFCNQCGREIPQDKVCANCNTPNAEDSKFCNQCGKPLSGQE